MNKTILIRTITMAIAFGLILMAFCIMFTGCSPKTTEPIMSKPAIQKTLTSSEAVWFMRRDNGIDSEYVTVDTYYIAVDEEWFKANVMDTFQSFLSKNGVYFADKKKNDCDDFARAFSFHARAKSMQAKFMDADLAVGDLYYRTLDMGHAINTAILLDKQGNKKLVFIEPQGPQGPSFVKLDEEYKKNYVFHIGI